MKKLHIIEMFFDLGENFNGDAQEALTAMCQYRLDNLDKAKTATQEEYEKDTSHRLKGIARIIEE